MILNDKLNSLYTRVLNDHVSMACDESIKRLKFLFSKIQFINALSTIDFEIASDKIFIILNNYFNITSVYHISLHDFLEMYKEEINNKILYIYSIQLLHESLMNSSQLRKRKLKNLLDSDIDSDMDIEGDYTRIDFNDSHDIFLNIRMCFSPK